MAQPKRGGTLAERLAARAAAQEAPAPPPAPGLSAELVEARETPDVRKDESATAAPTVRADRPWRARTEDRPRPGPESGSAGRGSPPASPTPDTDPPRFPSQPSDATAGVPSPPPGDSGSAPAPPVPPAADLDASGSDDVIDLATAESPPDIEVPVRDAPRRRRRPALRRPAGPPGEPDGTERPAAPPLITAPRGREAPTRRGVGGRLLPAPATRLTQREPREALALTVAVGRGIGLLSAAVLLALSLGDTTALPYAFAVAMGLTLFRLWLPAHSLTGHLVEVTLVAAVLVASGGMLGPFSLFAAATALAVGADRGLGSGLLAGTILSSAGVAATAGVLVGDLDAAIIGSWLMLYPLTAGLGSLTARALDVESDGQAALRDVNRVLRSLRTVADEAPAALQTTTVARAIAGELAETLSADATVVLLHRYGALVEVGRSGEVDMGHQLLPEGWEPLVHDGKRPLATLDLPPALRAALGGRDWMGMPLTSQDRLVGVALVDGAEVPTSREARRALRRTVAEIAIALDNATMFAEIEQLAAGAERQRIADDLHDGVAQQLTHVRFELELLGRHAKDDTVRTELARLSRVAHQATDDVRTSIRGLRATALDAGLGPAVQALVGNLETAGGPEMILDVRAPADLDVDVETEVFRIVQESLSNALRHAAADHILIEVDDLDGTLVVVVEDDGEGMEATADDPSDGDGLGLETMRARAERIGGRLDVGGNELGGTRVELRLPPRGQRLISEATGD